MKPITDQRRREFELGAHNLHDRAGTPTFFADALLFTEAIPATLRSRMKANAPGRELLSCNRQPDLAICLRSRLFHVESTAYRLAHEGEPEVTPHRGTFVARTTHLLTRHRLAFLVEHRINAAFDPWIRGEPALREDCWHKHEQLTLDWIDELQDDGYLVIAGGDLNTPPDVSGYRGRLNEVGHGLDRLGVSHSVYITKWERLGNAGSDHPRVRARVNLPA